MSLAILGLIYAVTAKIEAREEEGCPTGRIETLRVVLAGFIVGIFYLYGLFVTGYFQLGWFNLLWIVGVPVLVAALIGRDESERRWGGPFLIVPGFFSEFVLMIALGISAY